MARLIVSILLGVVITFLLFALMAFLIGGGERSIDAPPPPPSIDIVSTPPQQSEATRQRTPPPPPPPPQQPPQQPRTQPDTSDNTLTFNPDIAPVDLGGPSTGLSGPGSFGRDGEATPIVRIEPRFPPAALRDGISGWVRLRFTIDEAGGVTDVEVIEAEPRRLFDQEARRALNRWKYAPKIVDGRAVRQEGIVVQLDFNLEGG